MHLVCLVVVDHDVPFILDEYDKFTIRRSLG